VSNLRHLQTGYNQGCKKEKGKKPGKF